MHLPDRALATLQLCYAAPVCFLLLLLLLCLSLLACMSAAAAAAGWKGPLDDMQPSIAGAYC
jgi:type IV secretory pathway VirB2 component (pilin)